MAHCEWVCWVSVFSVVYLFPGAQGLNVCLLIDTFSKWVFQVGYFKALTLVNINILNNTHVYKLTVYLVFDVLVSNIME